MKWIKHFPVKNKVIKYNTIDVASIIFICVKEIIFIYKNIHNCY